ncbi:MAG: SNF2 helicase associated domain-containing protein [Verrucomicrobia bacterium]|nr:SNF2 helicase associated domain-containing protein [Verrucomicrobiota bacterium]
MSEVQLTDQFFQEIAGWEAVKQARAYITMGKVLSSNWTPPILKGVVQAGETSYRAGLVIKSSSDIENMCSCRESREWGKICAHSVGVGLHHLNRGKEESAVSSAPGGRTPAKTGATIKPAPAGKRLTRSDSGEPVEIFVILPPNLAQAAARGKVMLVLEGKWSRGRAPLNTLPLQQPFHFSPEDAALLEVAEEVADGDTPGMMQIENRDFSRILSKLVEHPRVTFGRTTDVEISREPLRLALKATLESSGEILLSLKTNPQSLALISGDKTSWVISGTKIQPLGLSRAYFQVLQGPVRLTRNQVPQFLGQEWPQLQASCDIETNFRIEDFLLEPQAPKFILALAGGMAQLHAQLQCAYGPRIMTVGVTSKDESLWLPDPTDSKRYSTRALGAEQAALNRLLKYGFNGPDAQGRYQLLGQNQVLTFFAREFPKLEKEWEVTLEERLQYSTAKNLERVEPRFEITSSGIQWFDLGVVFDTSGGEKFSQADIQRLILSGQSHTRLKNGKFALIDTGAVEELQEVLLDCSPDQAGGKYRINNTQAGFLESTLRQQGWRAQAPTQWRERALSQSGEAKLECPPLGDLEKVLRPYQKHGVAWLHFLRANKFGGILADEMGLGKTLQTLAFLNGVVERWSNGKNQHSNTPALQHSAPALIVCPTSLVFNWVNEVKKFTPHLRVLALHGPERHGRFSEIPNHDLIVTSYALVRRDAEKYSGIEFDTVVLDEAQHIKNRQTQNAQAVKAIWAEHRLVLTGTPLENSVLDLWSIFDFLMPGYLGSAQDFRERYELPIVKEKNAEAQGRLARRLRPFILRRLKVDVAKDLPAKIEQVSFCELTDDQRTVYNQILQLSRKEVLDAVGAQGVAKSKMVILTALLRLRQICCDLRLLKLERSDGVMESGSDGEEPNTPALQHSITPSGKLDTFSELLDEIIDGGHRVLVFSQFTTMLGLLREKLDAEGTEFCYLDGSTTNRGAVVERFQKTSSIPVFLISLKAGGVGLNLTGADTVVHFDPWWNPAVEDQATDRAHRIGQSKVVTSYKLITRDTVEEKILNLQTRKRELIKATLAGEAEFAAALSWEEIQELLA